MKLVLAVVFAAQVVGVSSAQEQEPIKTHIAREHVEVTATLSTAARIHFVCDTLTALSGVVDRIEEKAKDDLTYEEYSAYLQFRLSILDAVGIGKQRSCFIAGEVEIPVDKDDTGS